MPFVRDSDPSPAPPAKRRKLSSRMARYNTIRSNDIDEQFLFEASETLEACSGPQDEDPGRDAQDMVRTSDREELIQCIKRGQRTTWVPRPGLEALCAEVNAERNTASPTRSLLPRPKSNCHPAHGRDARADTDMASAGSSPSSATDALRRSLGALQAGDALEEIVCASTVLHPRPETLTPLRRQSYLPEYDGSSPPWQAESPPVPSLQYEQSRCTDMLRRSRAPSLGSSLSSSFVMRIPTSPLVQATNNPTLDFSPRHPAHTGTSQSARRKTMPPNAFDSLHTPPLDSAIPNFSRPSPHGQSSHNDGSSILSGHRPRRSLSSFTYQPATTSHIPLWSRQRRLSLAADTSSRQRASMVGSFEESILRGRMSSPPSKPFDFVAQIGVMGKGNCPASLKCPAHVSVPFPAVYYSYPSASSFRSISDDNPSPYVGSIDLEHNLRAPEELRQRPGRPQANLNLEELVAEITKPENTAIGKALARATRKKQEQTVVVPRVPPGGAYRVPQKGQLQVIIKNPNKTAVKLFLIPYDLEGMLPGMKTFVRQRSYSSGPILEATMWDKQATLAALDPLSAKDILRYLIHLKFCCTGKGRFYLYDNIRVVFANRVPDGKEKLRSEVQLPEPKFSSYRPTMGSPSRSPSIADEKFSPLLQSSTIPDFDELGGKEIRLKGAPDSSPTPLHLLPTSRCDRGLTDIGRSARGEQADGSPCERTVSAVPGFVPSTSARGSPVPWPAGDGPSIARSFSPTPVEAGHGLLSRKLRELNENSERRNE